MELPLKGAADGLRFDTSFIVPASTWDDLDCDGLLWWSEFGDSCLLGKEWEKGGRFPAKDTEDNGV